MKRLAFCAALAAGILLPVAMLYAAVASFAFSPGVYPSGVPYAEMAQALIDYLKGTLPALPEALFTERERLHMVDVLALFQGGRTLAIGFALVGALGLVFALWRGGLRAAGRGLLAGMGVLGLVVALVALWAAVDFSGWFTAMHELVFTNDLWLLDPAESMLIRMLPLDFFVRAVRTIALRFALGTVALAAAAVGMALHGNRRKDHDL